MERSRPCPVFRQGQRDVVVGMDVSKNVIVAGVLGAGV
jgi:hypothetical protein